MRTTLVSNSSASAWSASSGDDLEHRAIGPAGLQQVEPDVAVQSHEPGLVGVAPSRLEEDVVRDADLAQIVQQRGDFKPLEFRLLPAELPGGAGGEQCRAAAVPERGDVAEVHRGEQAPQQFSRKDVPQRIGGRGGLRAARERDQSEEHLRGIGRSLSTRTRLGPFL